MTVTYIQLAQATNATLGLPSRSIVITLSEIGKTAASPIFQVNSTTGGALQAPQYGGGAGSGSLPSQPSAPTIGTVVVDVNGFVVDDRDFANYSYSLRDQIAACMDKTILVANKITGGAATPLTSDQVRTYT